jgi:hypothetical protein
MAAPTDDPLKQLLDVFVYAPVGLLLEAKRLYPSIVETGRQHVDNQVKLARFVGEFAVRQGRKVAEQRIEEFLHPQSAPSSTSAMIESAAVESPVTESPTGVTIGEIAMESLAIDGYDTLVATQIVGRLVGLSRHDLDRIGRYEATHRARRTILSQIARLRRGAP